MGGGVWEELFGAVVGLGLGQDEVWEGDALGIGVSGLSATDSGEDGNGICIHHRLARFGSMRD